MASFPETDLHIMVDGYSEDHSDDPGVEEFKTDRGPSKLRVTNIYTMLPVTFTVEFRTLEALNNFLDWYRNTISKIGWFTWKDPRINYGTRTARFKSGKIGAVTPVVGTFGASRITVTLEYLQ